MDISEAFNIGKYFFDRLNKNLNKYKLSINTVYEKNFDNKSEIQKITIRNLGNREVKIDNIGYAYGGDVLFNSNDDKYEYFYNKHANIINKEEQLTNKIGDGLIIKPNETKYINCKSDDNLKNFKPYITDIAEKDNNSLDFYHKDKNITFRNVVVATDTDNNFYSSASYFEMKRLIKVMQLIIKNKKIN